MNLSADIKKLERHFLPYEFVITDWETLEPYFANLSQRVIESGEDLHQWL